MAGKIDYKEYLKSLGTIETDAKKRIQAYLEEQIKEDAALRELYRAEKIDDCYDFIKNAVRAMPGAGSSATVEDAIVFKMARDYFLDYAGAETATEAEAEAETEPETAEEIPADNENKADAESENEKPAETEEVMLHQADSEGESVESESSEAETEAATEEEKPTDNENKVVTDKYGFEIFGEEATEAGAETATEAEAEAETEPETAEENPVDNENEADAESENEKPEPDTPKYDKDGNGLLFDL